MKVAGKNIIFDIIAALLLLLFLYPAISKIIDHRNFEFTLAHSPFIKNYSKLIAYGLPAFEILTCVLLFLPSSRLFGLKISLALLTIFTIYLFYMVDFAPEKPCSCGGIISKLSWRGHILLNIFFICLSILGLFLYNKNKKYKTSIPP